jgi:hypothetical protein
MNKDNFVGPVWGQAAPSRVQYEPHRWEKGLHRHTRSISAQEVSGTLGNIGKWDIILSPELQGVQNWICLGC